MKRDFASPKKVMAKIVIALRLLLKKPWHIFTIYTEEAFPKTLWVSRIFASLSFFFVSKSTIGLVKDAGYTIEMRFFR